MRPSAPILQCLRPYCLLSRFTPHTIHSREKYLARLLCRIDPVSIGLSHKDGNIRLQTVLLDRQMVLRTVFRVEFSHQTLDLECFADSSNIPEFAHHSMFRPNCNHTTDVPSMILRTALSNPICF